ncbi:transposase [Falsirhodobacter algicola]|uniref:transposase n=1 Tax=Falsirhodobacter algicola TaxID=2692330 RepID=UPI0036F1BC1A
MMSTGNFSDDIKRDAVAQITELGYPATEVSARLGVGTHSLYAWQLDLPGKCGEHQLMNQEVFYGKREQTDAGVSA